MSIGTEHPSAHQSYSALPSLPSEQGNLSPQALTLRLEGITAGDYLAWVRDPEPPALGRELRSVAVEADPLGDRIELQLSWTREPPAARAAAVAAGFALIPESSYLNAEM